MKHPLINAASEWLNSVKENETLIAGRAKALREQHRALRKQLKANPKDKNAERQARFDEGLLRLAKAESELIRARTQAEDIARDTNQPVNLSEVESIYIEFKAWKEEFGLDLLPNKFFVGEYNHFLALSKRCLEEEDALLNNMRAHLHDKIQRLLNSNSDSPRLQELKQIKDILFGVPLPPSPMRRKGAEVVQAPLSAEEKAKAAKAKALADEATLKMLTKSVKKYDKKLYKDLIVLQTARKIKKGAKPETLELIQLVNGSGLESTAVEKLNSSRTLKKLNVISNAMQTLDLLTKKAPKEVKFALPKRKPTYWPMAIPAISPAPKVEFADEISLKIEEAKPSMSVKEGTAPTVAEKASVEPIKERETVLVTEPVAAPVNAGEAKQASTKKKFNLFDSLASVGEKLSVGFLTQPGGGLFAPVRTTPQVAVQNKSRQNKI